jgi:glycosyltransferase involved in cell wall biosynthesis
MKSSGDVGVCLATRAFYPLYAGPALRFQRYAGGLRQRGVHMQVFTQAVTEDLVRRDGSVAESGVQRAGAPGLCGDDEVDCLPVHRVKLQHGWQQQASFFRQLAGHCARRRSDVDVVQFLDLDVWATPWALRLRALGIRLVFTHTLLGTPSPRRWKQRLQRLYWRWPLNLMDDVVVSSGEMKKQLLPLGLSTRIQVIPNGVDIKRFCPVSDEVRFAIRDRLGVPRDARVVLAIGPIIPRKGVDALVEAFCAIARRHPDAMLLLVGPRHDLARDNLADFHRQLIGAITAARAERQVRFTGAVSNVQDYLRAADLLVFPSRREGMPNVVPEAMACGLPVIMTPFIGLPEEFGRAGAQYVLSGWRRDELAGHIHDLLVDAPARQQLGAAARRWVERTLDLNRSLNAYCALYRGRTSA